MGGGKGGGEEAKEVGRRQRRWGGGKGGRDVIGISNKWTCPNPLRYKRVYLK